MAKSLQLLKRDFAPRFWKDCDSYWLNIAPQGSTAWLHNRKLRLTASNFGAAIGKSKFSTPLEVAMDITGIKPKIFSDASKTVMDHGVKTEPIARHWYCQTYNIKIAEVGLAVPKWETRIGGSLDGDVLNDDGTSSEGMIEIKSPLTIYQPLLTHCSRVSNGWKPPEFYHDHIWDTHYAQMQGCMRITNKKWCDYVVYSTENQKSYVERILFNQIYWDTILYPGIINFLDNILEPLISKDIQE